MHLMTDGRREVEELSGQRAVPVLVTDDGEVVSDSKRIVAWAEANPAHRSGAGAGDAANSGAGSDPGASSASESGTGSATGS
jgi:glutathione S-transferase